MHVPAPASEQQAAQPARFLCKWSQREGQKSQPTRLAPLAQPQVFAAADAAAAAAQRAEQAAQAAKVQLSYHLVAFAPDPEGRQRECDMFNRIRDDFNFVFRWVSKGAVVTHRQLGLSGGRKAQQPASRRPSHQAWRGAQYLGQQDVLASWQSAQLRTCATHARAWAPRCRTGEVA